MKIDYEIKNCPHCNGKNFAIMGNEKEIYGLVSIKAGNIIDVNSLLPVIAIVCKECGHVELVHVNAKAIETNN